MFSGMRRLDVGPIRTRVRVIRDGGLGDEASTSEPDHNECEALAVALWTRRFGVGVGAEGSPSATGARKRQRRNIRRRSALLLSQQMAPTTFRELSRLWRSHARKHRR